MKKLILAAVFLLSTLTIFAQTTNDLIELVKSDVKVTRKALITETMVFTEAESEIFWPIYREYEYKLEELANKRIAILKDFTANYENLSNEKADDLMKASFSFLEDRLSLNEKYYKKFAKELSPTIAAKYYQVENEIQLLIDLSLASELPYAIKMPVTE